MSINLPSSRFTVNRSHVTCRHSTTSHGGGCRGAPRAHRNGPRFCDNCREQRIPVEDFLQPDLKADVRPSSAATQSLDGSALRDRYEDGTVNAA